jgi:hypothetical protein
MHVLNQQVFSLESTTGCDANTGVSLHPHIPNSHTAQTVLLVTLRDIGYRGNRLACNDASTVCYLPTDSSAVF